MHKRGKEASMILFDIEANGLLPDVTQIHCVVSLELPQNKKFGTEYSSSGMHKDSGKNSTEEPQFSTNTISSLLTTFLPDEIENAEQHLQKATTLIGHNIIGYDLPALWKLGSEWEQKPLIIDTLVLSRALWPERPWGHGLEAWGEHLGEKKIDFHDYENYSDEMLEYCKQDVIVNYLVFKELEKEYGKVIEEGYRVY